MFSLKTSDWWVCVFVCVFLTCWRWASLCLAPVQRWWSSCYVWGNQWEAPGLTSDPVHSRSPPAPPTELTPSAALTSPDGPPPHPCTHKYNDTDTAGSHIPDSIRPYFKFLCLKKVYSVKFEDTGVVKCLWPFPLLSSRSEEDTRRTKLEEKVDKKLSRDTHYQLNRTYNYESMLGVLLSCNALKAVIIRLRNKSLTVSQK